MPRKSRPQPFAVGQVVAVPAAQGGVAGVREKKFQRRRFNVAVAGSATKHARQITSAVNHAGNVNAIGSGHIKNQVISEGKRTQIVTEFGTWPANQRMFRQ